MRIFLTGSGGMLGHHIKVELESHGYQVIAPRRTDLDLKDAIATSKFIAKNTPDLVIHSAALVGGIQANITNGKKFLIENLQIDHSVIFGSLNSMVPNFIYLGSSCMYPANKMEPLVITDLMTGSLEPTNENYAIAKITGTKLIEAIDSDVGLNWKTFILSNLYGPGDHFEPDKAHLLAAIISKVSYALENNYTEISMWGDGKVRREFTYVVDLAKWIVGSVPVIQSFPSLLNVGCGNDHTVKEFYEIASEVLGFKGQIIPDLSKPNGNLRKLMDSSVARTLGWNPSTSLREGILSTHQWWVENRVKHEL
jgi:GDP-L-fucose synthase